jgi:quercetin dioxygenase-like cupin family protein
MKSFKLESMTRGWFVGDFKPTVYATKAAEVAVQKYDAGHTEKAHYHVQAIEITVIVTGRVRINQNFFEEGDIILIEKNEVTEFEALTDTTTVVFKSGSFGGDKYIVSKPN